MAGDVDGWEEQFVAGMMWSVARDWTSESSDEAVRAVKVVVMQGRGGMVQAWVELGGVRRGEAGA